MKPTPPKPRLSSRAPGLERLEKVEGWTEEPARAAAAALKPDEPWSVAMEPAKAEAVRLFNCNLPVSLYAQLKWVADTTYGANMTKLTIEALRAYLGPILEERKRGRSG